MPSSSPKGSIKSRALDLSSIQEGREFANNRLPTKADVVSFARFLQAAKSDNRNYPIKQISKDITSQIMSLYGSICAQFCPPVILSKNAIENLVFRLLKRAQITTPNLKGKDSKIEAFLMECQELFDIFACNRLVTICSSIFNIVCPKPWFLLSLCTLTQDIRRYGLCFLFKIGGSLWTLQSILLIHVILD